MPIAVEVARVTGWRLRNFPFTNCRDVPSPPPESPGKKLATGEKTLTELLDETAAYARAEIKKIRADIRKRRQNK